MIYLAAPYSHENPEIETERNRIIDNVTMNLVMMGFVVYSPITHGCALVRSAILDDTEIGTDWKAWERHCLGMLEKADSMMILALEGWAKSKGIDAEIDYCNENQIPVTILTELDIAKLIAKGGNL